MNIDNLVDQPYLNKDDFFHLFEKAKREGRLRYSSDKDSISSMGENVPPAWFLLKLIEKKSEKISVPNDSSFDELFEILSSNMEEIEEGLIHIFYINFYSFFKSRTDIRVGTTFDNLSLREKLDLLIRDNQQVNLYLADRNLLSLVTTLHEKFL